MRPITLTLKGFTSFRDEQVLDFTNLDLFAIAGPTGSGKSSLLDALTYALFGTVERVGRQVSQLVSQGQARMAVTLEFAVGGDRYRLTRSTPASGGSTKVLLQRADGSEWTSAGEGSDKVTDVNKKVLELIGLDYDAFTRSVLLPQGRFAEFLVGEPSKRREILTELLGLSLFKRMAQRAGEIAKEARQKAETTAELLEHEYEGVSAESLEVARATADTALAREEALGKAAARVQEIADRWRATQSIATTLRSCATDARVIEDAVRASARALTGASVEIAERIVKLAACSSRAHEATVAAEAATTARAEAERSWGRTAELADARARAQALHGSRSELSALAERLRQTSARSPVLADAVRAAAARLAADQQTVSTLDADIERARDTYRTLQRRNTVAAICEGLHEGDACPVCGNALATLPARSEQQVLERAEAEGKKLAGARAKAEQAVLAASRTHDAAVRDAAELGKEIARLETENTARRAALEAAERALASTFGGALPADPVAALSERIAALDALARAEQDTTKALREAEHERREAEGSIASARATAATERARLDAQPIASVLARARDVLTPPIPNVAALPASDDPKTLATGAAATADGLSALAASLGEQAGRHDVGERALLAEALCDTGDLLPPARSLEDLLASVASALRASTSAAATARRDADMLAARLAKRAELARVVDELGARADRFKVLAKELQANNLIAFLQTEALHVLSAAGTAHLSSLSDGRYRLACEDDEFMVLDTWNGEEKRSVKTLSGGETFMASLALALALSEHVQSLGAGGAARLESLFLDEGFGTLDPDSLEEVVQAIEQLGGDGRRMVGVITHITELADRLPTKITVEKTPRGSHVRAQPATA